MKRVGIREFKEKATVLLAEAEAMVVERHGTPIGFYIPLPKKDKAEAQRAAERLQQTVDKVLEQTGMTEDELVAFMTEDWEESVRGAARR